MRTVEKLKGAERRAHDKLVSMSLYETSYPYQQPEDFGTTKEREAVRASRRLNMQLMRYDAAFHPQPDLFVQWAEGVRGCPYRQFLGYDDDLNPIVAERQIEYFHESRHLFRPGRALSAVKLLALVRKTRALRRRAGFSVDE